MPHGFAGFVDSQLDQASRRQLLAAGDEPHLGFADSGRE
jgi:hypothetical protein